MAQRVAYENAWLTLTEDDVTFADGTTGIYGVVHKRDYAVVVAVDGDRVHLVEQFRYPVGMRRWELPQGAVPEANTTPEGIASTELAEETGLRAGHLQVIGFLPGYMSLRGGVLVPNPDIVLFGLTDAAGTLPLSLVWPASPPSYGVFFQYGVFDGAAVQGVAMSNALQVIQ